MYVSDRPAHLPVISVTVQSSTGNTKNCASKRSCAKVASYCKPSLGSKEGQALQISCLGRVPAEEGIGDEVVAAASRQVQRGVLAPVGGVYLHLQAFDFKSAACSLVMITRKA